MTLEALIEKLRTTDGLKTVTLDKRHTRALLLWFETARNSMAENNELAQTVEYLRRTVEARELTVRQLEQRLKSTS